MENDKILTFIITDREDKGFVNTIYRADNIMEYGNGIVIHEPRYFMTLISQAISTFRFRVLIHLGLKDRPEPAGLMHLGTLKSYFKVDEFVIISREPDLFPNNEMSVPWNNFKVFNTNNINTTEFIDQLRIFTKSEIVRLPKETIDNSNGKDLDFAILTALSEDEYSVFRNKVKEPKKESESSNYIISHFDKLTTDDNADYLEDFILYRQHQMGMVEAAICSNKIIHELKPKILIMGGVCGGRRGKIERYDIIIPKQIIEFTTGKLEDGLPKTYAYSSKTHEMLHSWLCEPNRVEALKTKMFSLIPPFESDYKTICGNISIRFDDIACVPWVVKTDEWLEENAKQYDEKIVGLEMESYGVNRSYELNQKKIFSSLVVKSVMDFTENDKVDTDKKTGEKYKKNASYISYLCIRALMPMLKEFYIRNT